MKYIEMVVFILTMEKLNLVNEITYLCVVRLYIVTVYTVYRVHKSNVLL